MYLDRITKSHSLLRSHFSGVTQRSTPQTAAENWTTFLSRPLANHSIGSRIQNHRVPTVLLGDSSSHSLCFIGDSRVRDKRKSSCWFGKEFSTRRYGWFPIGDNRPGKCTRGLTISEKGWLLESEEVEVVEVLASVPNRSDSKLSLKGFQDWREAVLRRAFHLQIAAAV